MLKVQKIQARLEILNWVELGVTPLQSIAVGMVAECTSVAASEGRMYDSIGMV